MVEPISEVSVGVMKGLVQLVNSNQLTVAALEKAAAGANMSVGQLLAGIQAQQGGPVGAARSAARTLFTAVSRMPEAPALQAAMNNAAKQTAVQIVEKGGELIARQTAKELALNAAKATRSTLIKIATKIGQLIIGNSPKAGALGGVILIFVIGLILWKLIGILNDPMANNPGQPGSLAGAGAGGGNPNDGRLQGSLTGSSLPGSGDTNTSGSSPFTLLVAPPWVDKTSYHGVWVKPSYVQGGVARAVLVQSGNSVNGRIEISGGIHGNGKLLIASGTYDLNGTIDADNRLTFKMANFDGDVGLGRTGMHLDGYLNAPGGMLLGYPMSLQRQIEPKK